MSDEISANPHPLPITEHIDSSIAQAIGFLFITAGAAESALAFQVLRMMVHPDPLPPHSVALVGGMDVNVKLTQIRIYAAMRAQNHKKSISASCDDIRSAFGKRNLFAHSIVSPADRPDHVSVQPLKFDSSGNFPDPQQHSRAQIEGYAQAIHSSVRALVDQLNEIGFRKLTD